MLSHGRRKYTLPKLLKPGTGKSEAQIIEEFPGITRDHVAACIAYADEIEECRGALKDAEKSGTISFDEVKKKFGL